MGVNTNPIDKNSIGVVIPVFNNSETLEGLISEISIALDVADMPQYELVFVDDGSTDTSLSRLIELKRESKCKIKIVKLAGNFGQVNAVIAGVRECQTKWIATISADLQDPPSIVREMYLATGGNKRIVIAERSSRGDGTIISMRSRIVYFLLRRINRNIPIGGFDCWMIDKKIAEFVLSRNGLSALRQLNFIDSGIPFSVVTYHRRKRLAGESGWTFRAKFRAFIQILGQSFAYTAKTLILVGSIITSFSLLMLLIVLYGYLFGNSPFSGFTLIVSLLILFGSFLITVICLMLSMLSSLLTNQKNYGEFVIDEIM